LHYYSVFQNDVVSAFSVIFMSASGAVHRAGMSGASVTGDSPEKQRVGIIGHDHGAADQAWSSDNSLQEAPLTGQLWIRQADGSEVQGANYLVRTPPMEFRTNAEGYWMLPNLKRLPIGSIQAELVRPDGVLLGRGSFCLPIPIFAQLLGGQRYRMTFDQTRRQLNIAATLTCVAFGSPLAASQSSISQSEVTSWIDVKQITLRETGHRKSPAEIYFRAYLDGKELQSFGLPAKDRQNSWLLLVDNQPAAPNGLQVAIPRPGLLRLELWDRDRSMATYFRDSDDRLAMFTLQVHPKDRGTKVLKDRGNEIVLLVR
jgi:hypothetical protein